MSENIKESYKYESDKSLSKTNTIGKEATTRTFGKMREIEGRDSVGLYLDEIARTPLLDAMQEVELAKAIEAGLTAEYLLKEGEINANIDSNASQEELEWLVEEGLRAKDTFLTANLRLVVSIARKYGRAAMPILDLVQEGNTGLIRAVEKFDYTKGYKFSTYATWWIRQAITRGIAQQARVVRLPIHVVEELNQLGGARRTLERQLGREPEPQEIAAELGMETERVLDLMAWGREHVSLDASIDDDGDTSLGDLIAHRTISNTEDGVINQMRHEQLHSIIANLDDRAADIIRSRYGLVDGRQEKLADIGVRHGISAERVRQLEREILQKLRHYTDPEGNSEFDNSKIAQEATKETQRATDRRQSHARYTGKVHKRYEAMLADKAKLTNDEVLLLEVLSATHSQWQAAQALSLSVRGLQSRLKVIKKKL